ncbi:carboxymuconolactone decarboxylase family protein [Aestuariivita sp.]|uniref:carboxymuconolactone decarboxylase family protein n=1 Tax=Aestuariivita sp. TaxID=1872407 RepID=UPI00216CD484|nr:carboxymuconolactone decarboxylase family protein [Aestuariivita sp.]MCE8007014.1 4-carboxymuconolactone decarboxylase [Aestuariivita sp.]
MSELFDKGLKVRRELLGDEYVDKAFSEATSLTEDFQTMITEFCWGSVWAREGFPRKYRSIVNLALLTALDRPNEFRMHVRVALKNGLTPEDIREILLQCAAYAGVPAAFDSFLIVKEVLEEMEGESPAT